MKEVLASLNFDQKEIEIFLALLKVSKGSVTLLMKNTQIERRTIYDVLERLIQKGYVSFFEEDNTRIYQPINPDLLLEELEVKKEELKKILPQLHAIGEDVTDTSVSVLTGTKGVSTIFYEIIHSKEIHYAYGDITPFLTDMDRETNKFLRAMKREGLKEKILHCKSQKIEKIPNGKYRIIAPEIVPPTPTIIYGDVVAQFVFSKPIKIVLIKSKEIAQSHKMFFDSLWMQAK